MENNQIISEKPTSTLVDIANEDAIGFLDSLNGFGELFAFVVPFGLLVWSAGKSLSYYRDNSTKDAELEEVIESLLKRDRFKMIIDLAGVEYISSAGWGIFISHIKDIHENGGDLKLANMIANVTEIYELLEFDNVLKAYVSLEDARDDFGDMEPLGEIKKKEQQ